MGWLWQDARFGFRTILKDRGFFLAAVLALALGIGSATAIFSVIYNVLLQPFPYIDSHRLFDVRIQDTAGGQVRNWFSVPEFLEYQAQNHIFDRTMGVWEETTLLGALHSPEPLDTDTVTGNTFQFLGVSPLLGRGILPRDAQPGAPPVFVLSYKVWVKRFGMDRGIVGKNFPFEWQAYHSRRSHAAALYILGRRHLDACFTRSRRSRSFPPSLRYVRPFEAGARSSNGFRRHADLGQAVIENLPRNIPERI